VRAACFAPGEPIPRELLRATLDLGPNDANSSYRASDALSLAASLGLIEQRREGALVLHRLVASFIRNEYNEAIAVAQRAVEAATLKAARDINEAGYPAPLATWLGQLRFVAEGALREPANPRAGALMNELGHHLSAVADPGAKVAFEAALRADETFYGPDHHVVANRLNGLGLALMDMNDFPAARKAFERARQIDERLYGPDHPLVAAIIDNIGVVLHELRNLGAARAAFERARDINAKFYGPNAPEVATSLNHLSLVMRDLGDLRAGHALIQIALSLDEHALGDHHPKVAADLRALGRILHDSNDLEGARAAFERACRIEETVHGSSHPRLADALTCLGRVLRDQGDPLGAKAAFERASQIFAAG